MKLPIFGVITANFAWVWRVGDIPLIIFRSDLQVLMKLRYLIDNDVFILIFCLYCLKNSFSVHEAEVTWTGFLHREFGKLDMRNICFRIPRIFNGTPTGIWSPKCSFHHRNSVRRFPFIFSRSQSST